MTSLAKMYSDGVGVGKDCNKSIELLKKAINNGDPNATKVLAGMYYEGFCVVKNISCSSELYESLNRYLEEDDFYIGERSFWGIGVDIDYDKAVKIIKKNYESSVYSAGYTLGIAYAYGYGVEKDYEKMYKYFLESAMAGNNKSQFNVGFCLYNGMGVQVDQKKAVEWVMRAANKNHVKSLAFMGDIHMTGEVVEKDIEKAKEYYQKASERGSEKAKKRLESLQ